MMMIIVEVIIVKDTKEDIVEDISMVMDEDTVVMDGDTVVMDEDTVVMDKDTVVMDEDTMVMDEPMDMAMVDTKATIEAIMVTELT